MTVRYLDQITLASGAVTQVHFSQLPQDVAYTDATNVFTAQPQTVATLWFKNLDHGTTTAFFGGSDDGFGNFFASFACNAQLTSGNWFHFDTTKPVLLFQVEAGAAGALFNIYSASAGADPIGNFQLVFQIDGLNLVTQNTGQMQLINSAIGTTPLLVFGANGQTAPLQQFQETTDVQNRPMADVDALWANSSDASRKGRLVLRAWDTAAREGLRVEASGSVSLLGFFGSVAVGQQSGTGVTGGYSDSGTTVVHTAGTFTGGSGLAAYTIGDIVSALKKLGLIAT